MRFPFPRRQLGPLAVAAFTLLRAAAAQAEPVAPTPPAPAPRVLWKYAPPGANFDQVVHHDGVLFALDRAGSIHALDAATGTKTWITKGRFPFDRGFGLALATTPKFIAIVVGCDNGLVALDRRDGSVIWHTKIEAGVAGPAVANDVVVAGGADGRVYGCELATGRIRWQHDYLEDRPDDPPGFPGHQARFQQPARPGEAAADGKIVALSIFDQCRTLALDAASGKRLWAFRTEGWMYGRPTIGPLFVYVGSQDNRVYAIDKEIGKLAWKLDTKGRNEAAAALTARFVYYGSCDGTVYALDPAVGRVAWQFPIRVPEGSTSAIYGCPVVLGDCVHVAAMAGTIHAVHRDTGKQQWQFRPLADSELIGGLATDGGRLFATTRKSAEDKGESAVVAIARP